MDFGGFWCSVMAFNDVFSRLHGAESGEKFHFNDGIGLIVWESDRKYD